MNCSGTTQLALVLRRFLGEDVALERLTPLDGAASANLKALRRAFLGLHLGHDRTLLAAYAGDDQTLLIILFRTWHLLVGIFAVLI